MKRSRARRAPRFARSIIPGAHPDFRRVRSRRYHQVHDLPPRAPERRPSDPDIAGAQRYAPLLVSRCPTHGHQSASAGGDRTQCPCYRRGRGGRVRVSESAALRRPSSVAGRPDVEMLTGPLEIDLSLRARSPERRAPSRSRLGWHRPRNRRPRRRRGASSSTTVEALVASVAGYRLSRQSPDPHAGYRNSWCAATKPDQGPLISYHTP